MKRLLIAILVTLPAPAALCQGFEGTVFGGYTSAGGIDQTALGIDDLKLKGSFTWGIGAGYFFSPRLGVEASWARQETALAITTSAGSANMFVVNADQLHGSLVYVLGGAQSHLRPYLSAGLGATFFGARDLDETKLSFGLGAGLRWLPPGGKLGARVQARYNPTRLGAGSSDYCAPFGFCQDWLQQFELTGGVVVRF
jgi:hypothetical protein